MNDLTISERNSAYRSELSKRESRLAEFKAKLDAFCQAEGVALGINTYNDDTGSIGVHFDGNRPYEDANFEWGD